MSKSSPARKYPAAAFALAALLLAPASPAHAQPGLQQEIAGLKAGQLALQKQLEEIKQILLKLPARPEAPLAVLPPTMDAAGVLVKGDPNAPITIVEFTDIQCPFCGRYALNTLAKIDDAYIKTGKVRYVVKDFPLETIHGNALRAAQATHCAAEQRRAWDMHDRLFANQQKLTAADIVGFAGTLGLDTASFQSCLESGRYADEIRQEIAAGQAAGVSGTPTFFLGESGPNPDRMKPQRMLSGALDFAAFQSVIDGLAPQARQEPKPQAKPDAKEELQ